MATTSAEGLSLLFGVCLTEESLLCDELLRISETSRRFTRQWRATHYYPEMCRLALQRRAFQAARRRARAQEVYERFEYQTILSYIVILSTHFLEGPEILRVTELNLRNNRPESLTWVPVNHRIRSIQERAAAARRDPQDLVIEWP